MEDHVKPNLDILILGIVTSPDAQACARVLSRYSDLTLFTSPVPNICPDLVILATGDLYSNISAMKNYKDSNFLAVQYPMTKAAIGSYIMCGVTTIVEPVCTKDELYTLVCNAAAASGNLSRRKLTNLINEDYFINDDTPLTFKEAAYLGAIVRGYKEKEIASLFDTSIKDVRILSYRGLKKLGIKKSEFKTTNNIRIFGSIEPGPKYKQYIIPKGRLHRSGFFTIPRFLEES